MNIDLTASEFSEIQLTLHKKYLDYKRIGVDPNSEYMIGLSRLMAKWNQFGHETFDKEQVHADDRT